MAVATLTGDNGLLTRAGKAKQASEESALKEEISLKILQVKMGEDIEDVFKDGTVIKDDTVYEVAYKGIEFLISSDYSYIEKVEPAYEGEWTFNKTTQTLTEYNGDLTTKRGNQEIGEIIVPNYYQGKWVKKIEHNLFSNNQDLTRLIISDGIKIIDWSCFSNCNNLSGNLTIPDSVQTIGQWAFQNCSGLNGQLKIGSNVQNIGKASFSGCSNLIGDLIIPNSTTIIKESAFSGCSAFNGIIRLGNNLQTIENTAFSGCSNLVGDLTIPDSVQVLGYRAFQNCSSLNGSLKISSNLQEIQWYAFIGCNNLKGDVILSKQISTIGTQAFNGCTNLNSITFYNETTSIVDNSNTIASNIIIRGYSGSTAESYANKYTRIFDIIQTN